MAAVASLQAAARAVYVPFAGGEAAAVVLDKVIVLFCGGDHALSCADSRLCLVLMVWQLPA